VHSKQQSDNETHDTENYNGSAKYTS